MSLEDTSGISKVGKMLVPMQEYVNTYNNGYERIDRGKYKIIRHYMDTSSFFVPHYFEIEYYGRKMIIKDDYAIDVLDTLF